MSFGGHFLEAGWTIQLFALYRQQNDFSVQIGTVIQTNLSLLDNTNIDVLGNFLLKPEWSVDVHKQWNETAAKGVFDLSPLSVLQAHVNGIQSTLPAM